MINEILYKGAAKVINKTKGEAGKYDEIIGLENVDKIIDIDQSPIGRTPEIQSSHLYWNVHPYQRSVRISAGVQDQRIRKGKIQLQCEGRQM